MSEIKSAEALWDMLSAYEQEVTESITAELKRINRRVPMSELDFTPFTDDVKDYIEAIRLDEQGLPVLDTSFNNVSEKYLSACIADNEIDHWDMMGLLEQLQEVSGELKTYTLTGMDGRENIFFTINDLRALKSKPRKFEDLINYLDYSNYEPDWDNPMKKDYELLYAKAENKGRDFFQIGNTGIVVIPGKYVCTTVLNAEQFRNTLF